MSKSERVYERTHPWLRFHIDLSGPNHRLWLMLGEARSKCEHLSRVPMKPQLAQALHQVLLAKGIHATTAIEGNTLSEEQVRLRIDDKLTLPASREYLGKEVDNILDAIEDILRNVMETGRGEIQPAEIADMNRRVLAGLDLAEEVVPGAVRTHEVGVANYSGAPAQDCGFLLERLCTWLNEPEFRPHGDMAIPLGIVRAVLAHLYLAWIHPFGDGNGRTARIVEFKILVASGIPTAAAHLLSNHYNATRSEYYRQLAHASASGGDVHPFLLYAVQGFVDGLREQLEPVWAQQWDLAWRDYVHSELQGDGKAERRMRHLVLDLADEPEPVPLSRLKLISPRVAADYAVVGDRTVSRDVAALLVQKVIVSTKKGISANRDLIQAFRPLRLGGEDA